MITIIIAGYAENNKKKDEYYPDGVSLRLHIPSQLPKEFKFINEIIIDNMIEDFI